MRLAFRGGIAQVVAGLIFLLPSQAPAVPVSSSDFPGINNIDYTKDGVVQTTIQLLQTVFQIISPPTTVGLNPPIGVSFAETVTSYTLSVAGGTPIGRTTETFSLNGSYWRGPLSITQNSLFLGADELSLSGAPFHAVDPDDGVGSPVSFNYLLKDPTNSMSSNATGSHGDGDTDSFVFSANASVEPPGFLRGATILSWTLTEHGEHIDVPEPHTLALFGTGILLLMGLREWHCRKQSIA
jgi:hypothetical protein